MPAAAGAAVGAFTPSPIRIAKGGTHAVADFLADEQGPNYAVAKLLQKFRAVWSRHGENFSPKRADRMEACKTVGVHLTGPAAKTDSVTSPQMALVMNNMDSVCPNVAHDPETVQALMPLILIRDFSRPRSGQPIERGGWRQGGSHEFCLRTRGMAVVEEPVFARRWAFPFFKSVRVRYLLPCWHWQRSWSLTPLFSNRSVMPALQFGDFCKNVFCLVL